MTRWRFLLAAGLAVAGGVMTPATSNAAFTLKIDELDSSNNVVNSTNTLTLTPTQGVASYSNFLFNHYVVAINTFTNSPGTPTLGQVTESTFDFTNVGSGTGKIRVTVLDDSFTQPFGKASVNTMLSPNGGFTSAGVIGMGSTQVNGVTIGGTVTATGATAVPVTTTGIVTIPSTGYSLGNTLVISGLTGSNTAHFDLSSTVVAPAPAGLPLALAALPVLGLFRRKFMAARATTAV